ncbi:MAG TPA: reverse transcriptase domain-containing protein [Nitrososphaera sp.]|nr:reverse transcriptase domain-containing protein [Nitrososphaera sp.]
MTTPALGFESLSTEVCFFYNKALRAYLVIYVDDVLVSAPSTSVINRVYSELGKHFRMKRLGPIKSFLGYNIRRDR